MKTIRLIRMLSLLGFLLLFAPFYDSCDKKDELQKPEEKNVIKIIDTSPFTGFEIAGFTYIAIENSTFKEFKEEFPKSFQNKGWYKDLGLFISFLFDFIVLISFSLFILSFFKKQNLITKLALTNCILIIITFLYIIFLESSFEHIRQIKWGYYAFIIANLLIFYYSKKNKIQT